MAKARRTRSNVPLPPGLKSEDIKPASIGAGNYTALQREQAREYIEAKRLESQTKKESKSRQQEPDLPAAIAAAQRGVIESDPDFVESTPELLATSGGVQVAGTTTGGQGRVVAPQPPRNNISFSEIVRDIKSNQLMSATEAITNIGYLSRAGAEPGIVEEVYLIPSLTGMGSSLLNKNQIISERVSGLTPGQIKSLKIDFFRKGLYSSDSAADLSLRSGALPDENFRQIYQDLTRQASLYNYSQATKNKSNFLSPEDYINLITEVPTRSTSTEITIPGREDADAVLRAQYQEYVGRAPNQKELAAFRASVESAASRRPTITTTTAGEPTPGLGVGDGSSFRQTGFTANTIGEMAREAARANPESAPYQKATKYFDTFLESLPAARGLEVQGTDLQELLTQGGVS